MIRSDFPTILSHATTPFTLATPTDTTGRIGMAASLSSPLSSVSHLDTNGVLDRLELAQRIS